MDGKLANVIEAFRNHNVHYIPGGGGTFGQLHLDEYWWITEDKKEYNKKITAI